ncbi:polyketide synthase dehydratase domain-containing protein, partial [Verrucomicrobia bacterium]|nr:polyketide synthase dehydratase domain-containing protein [Verrucomicrobiota bacterium]
MSNFLSASDEVSLHHLAYTLSVGRNHFRFRYCTVVSTLENLQEQLAAGKHHLGDSKQFAGGRIDSFETVEAVINDLDETALKARLETVGNLYCTGRNVDWKQLFTNHPGKRLSLPTYPFDDRRYWIPEKGSENKAVEDTNLSSSEGGKVAPGVMGRSLAFSEYESYLCDHVIGGKPILPGMAYLAFAKAHVPSSSFYRFSEIHFQLPYVLPDTNAKANLEIRLNPDEKMQRIEFVGESGNIHATMQYSGDESWKEIVDIKTLMDACKEEKSASLAYDLFARLGVDYGSSFRVIQRMWCGGDIVVGELKSKNQLKRDGMGRMIPLLDGALQSIIGFIGDADQQNHYLPTRIGEFCCRDIDALDHCLVVARKGRIQTDTEKSFNIILTDESGDVFVKIREFVISAVDFPSKVDFKKGKGEFRVTSATDVQWSRLVLVDLAKLVSSVLKIPVEEVSATDDLSEYGFDSITLTELANQVFDLFGIQMSAAILFEHSTLSSFADYLIEEHGQVLRIHYKLPERDSIVESSPDPVRHHTGEPTVAKLNGNHTSDAVAVVGIAGVFPQCPTIEAYWQALAEGRDLISEIPTDRWDWRDYFGDPQNEPNKTRVKFGGFIENVDGFDAAFFGISPREAELMDPQHRLFLETVWQALEDAALKPSQLAGSKTGVFVGIASQDYKEILGEQGINIDAYAATGMAHCLVANRVSYLLNLHGPSEAIDTACSSSLVAVHRGIEALRDGSCDCVLAGGVNLMLTPSLFISFDRAGMLSPDGRCKPFDSRANGYARGEGAGVVVLKRLSQAEADGDHIYSVIRGSGVNHGGRANSLTAPNPKAQAQLLIDIYRREGIDPVTLSYIEAHGTGTSLGDPIEFNGLKRAFSGLESEFGSKVPPQNCALGSVKGNIGHLETAAGIAGLLKVILGIKHRVLPPTLNYQRANHQLDLVKSPFYIVDKVREWVPLTENGRSQPLRAGVSSFGFGGANAHVILEEYSPSFIHAANKVLPDMIPNRHFLIPLSARNSKALRDLAENLLVHLSGHSSVRTEDIAQTMQFGRQSFKCRVAFVCSVQEELVVLLQAFLNGISSANIFTAGSSHGTMAEGLFEGEEAEEFVAALGRRRKWEQLARIWVNGGNFNWPKPEEGDSRRISLPGYPFQHERYWYQSDGITSARPPMMNRKHPLVAENISTLSQQSYRLGLTGQETIFKDHVIGDTALLPFAAQVEMALFAGGDAGGRPVTSLDNVSCSRALTDHEAVEAYMVLFPDGTSTGLEICRDGLAGTRIVYSSCTIGFQTERRPDPIDLATIRRNCSRSIDPEKCYERFETQTVHYGATLQVLRSVTLGEEEVLAEVGLRRKDAVELYRVVPEMLDGAVQSLAALMISEPSALAWVPRKIKRIIIWEDLPSRIFVHAVRHSNKTSEKCCFDVQVCDEVGKILLIMEGFQF